MGAHAQTHTFIQQRGRSWRQWALTVDLNNRRVTATATTGRVTGADVTRQTRTTVRRFTDRATIHAHVAKATRGKVRAGFLRLS